MRRFQIYTFTHIDFPCMLTSRVYLRADHCTDRFRRISRMNALFCHMPICQHDDLQGLRFGHKGTLAHECTDIPAQRVGVVLILRGNAPPQTHAKLSRIMTTEHRKNSDFSPTPQHRRTDMVTQNSDFSPKYHNGTIVPKGRQYSIAHSVFTRACDRLAQMYKATLSAPKGRIVGDDNRVLLAQRYRGALTWRSASPTC